MLQNGLQGRTLQGVGVGQLDGGGILRLTLTESFPVSLVIILYVTLFSYTGKSWYGGIRYPVSKVRARAQKLPAEVGPETQDQCTSA